MDIKELYHELIIDHGTHPRNFYVIEDPCSSSEGFNPLCGDRIQLYLSISNQSLKDLSFQGHACAICMASASLMTETLKGKSEIEAKTLSLSFKESLTTQTNSPQTLGKLDALLGVKAFPARVKCATLPWHTLEAALNRLNQIVSTENA